MDETRLREQMDRWMTSLTEANQRSIDRNEPTILQEWNRGAAFAYARCILELERILTEADPPAARPLSETDDEKGHFTWCPEHGLDVKIDEDGCCIGCGRDAYPLQHAIEEGMADAQAAQREADQVAPSRPHETETLRRALQSIANSSCCGCCQEAALVAKKALAETPPRETPE